MYAGKLRLFEFAPFLPGDGVDFEGKDKKKQKREPFGSRLCMGRIKQR
jgi:hypothetical protein